MTLHTILSTLVLVAALCIALSLIGYQLRTGVPALSSSAAERADVVALLRQAGLGQGLDIKRRAVIYELGSGWGSLVIALAKAFPETEIRGVELSPFPYLISKLRCRRLGNVRLFRRSFFDCDLSDADAVTCYLMMKPMPKIAALLDRTLRPGTPVVSLSFWFRDRKVSSSLENAGRLGAAALYLWPARKDGSQ